MQYSALLVAVMATFAAAAPKAAPGGYGCTPATYACDGKYAWKVCNTQGQWVFAGDCPPDTICKFYPPSKSPYCVPPGFKFP
ncbi:hypothetical protein BGZ61DRAFT_346904 [Ilyonectria robusta]|uniref:uncharacterized protein n=1 Tax=Ilyonectria robusta TaxID=1079257 RepID=UPI001E8E19DB|nr:uncharacterized protein BGZ61DRAFT_346904 [Ilyonectria robusta]KAH8721875.1 hypothetical protein BGZ61DRAFT_346904 [Ilyonectria robusta]